MITDIDNPVVAMVDYELNAFEDRMKRYHGEKRGVIKGKMLLAGRIEDQVAIKYPEETPTRKELLRVIANVAENLTNKNFYNYQYITGMALCEAVYIEAGFALGLNRPLTSDDFGTFIHKMIEKELIIDLYKVSKLSQSDTENVINLAGHCINFDNDTLMSGAAARQLIGKYLIQNRKDKIHYEVPQFLFAGIQLMSALSDESSTTVERALELFTEAYYEFTNHNVTASTPLMAGFRTPEEQSASCVKIDVGDTMPSIRAAVHAILNYIPKKAGLGINIGRLRHNGAAVGDNATKTSTGPIGFIKLFQNAVTSCSQGGIRKGSATVFFPIFSMDVEHLLILRRAGGNESVRARNVNYAPQYNEYLLRRLMTEDEFPLVSVSERDCPGLIEAFYSHDQEEFARLYEMYAADPTKSITVKSEELLALWAKEIFGTGGMYTHDVGNSNRFSPWVEDETCPQSNLCMEIILPTSPVIEMSRSVYFDTTTNSTKLTDEKDGNQEVNVGETALCNLSAQNWGKVGDVRGFTFDQLRKHLTAVFQQSSRVLVRLLDNTLSRQEYLTPAAAASTLSIRPLGIGCSNLAYLLAANGMDYDSLEAPQLIAKVAEAHQYFLLKASMELSIERGRAPGFNRSKYSKGLTPADWYCKNVDSIAPDAPLFDWKTLGQEIKVNGLRNLTLSAYMPGESSSQVITATNGVNRVKQELVAKDGGDSIHKQLAYLCDEVEYTTLFQHKNNFGYLSVMAAIQKWTDQAISTELAFKYRNDMVSGVETKISGTEYFECLLYACWLGLKTIYYTVVDDGSTDDSANVDDCDFCKS